VHLLVINIHRTKNARYENLKKIYVIYFCLRIFVRFERNSEQQIFTKCCWTSASFMKIDAGKPLLFYGLQRSFIYASTVKACDILKVKIAFAKITSSRIAPFVLLFHTALTWLFIKRLLAMIILPLCTDTPCVLVGPILALYMWMKRNAFAPSGNRILVV
jgi:hypothetical protein